MSFLEKSSDNGVDISRLGAVFSFAKGILCMNEMANGFHMVKVATHCADVLKFTVSKKVGV